MLFCLLLILEQRRKGKGKRKNSGKQHVKFNPSNPAGLQKTTDFLANMADPVKPFLIPRLVPTEAVPNNFRCVKTITPDPAKQWAVFMVQPSFDTPIVQMIQDEAPVSYSSKQLETYHHLQASSQNMKIDFDNELVGNNGTRISPTPIAEGLHYGENFQMVEEGGKAYSGSVATINANVFWLDVKNNGKASVTVNVGLEAVTNGIRSGAITWGTDTAVASDATLQAPSGAFTNIPGMTGFCVCFKWKWTTADSKTTASLDLGVSGALNVGGSYHWKPYPFLPPGGDYNDANANFRRAVGVSTTGFSVPMQNNASIMNRGGTLHAVQLRGGSRREIPGDPASIVDYVSNKTGLDVLPSAQLSDGLFWWYHPEKLQDIMFRPHVSTENAFLWWCLFYPLPYLAYYQQVY